MSDKNAYFVISCDGGGIRGLITALLLRDLVKRFGADLLDRVDMFAGTSTGSLIALGLGSQKLTIDEIVHIYETDCSKVFQPYVPSAAEKEAIQSIRTALQSAVASSDAPSELAAQWFLPDAVYYPKWTDDSFAKLLREKMEETTFGQVKKHILAATLWINAVPHWKPVAMTNLPNPGKYPDFPDCSQVTLVDAALSSAAAPCYFKPHKLKGTSDEYIDGGVFANNPASLALAVLQGSGLVGGDNGVPLKNVFMLSLSTGSNHNRFPPPDKPWFPYGWYPHGIFGWLWPFQTSTTTDFPLLNAIFDGVAQIDSFQAAMTLGPNNYQRADPPLGKEPIALDDCRAVPQLKSIAKEYIKNHVHWKQVVQWIESKWLG
jgi:uncharacterized protein